jgi:hypothetical protein
MVVDIRTIWPWVMLFLLVDGLYALNGGLMRGLGLQGRSILHRIAQGPQFANVRSSCCSAKRIGDVRIAVDVRHPNHLLGSSWQVASIRLLRLLIWHLGLAVCLRI